MPRAPLAVLVLIALATASCRRAPVDPREPGGRDAGRDDGGRGRQLPACPAGAPHLAIGVQAWSSDTEQALLRYTEDLVECEGLSLPSIEYRRLRVVEGLSDGSELVSFSTDYGYEGSLVRFQGRNIIARIDDEDYHPIDIAALPFAGEAAVAVLWGTSSSSSDSGERLDVYRTSDLSLLGSWDVSSSLSRVAAPPSGQANRIAAAIAFEGLQEQRADPGGITLATTGELAVANPDSWSLRSLDVAGENVRAATPRGVLSWRMNTAPAFLGPVHCRWPDAVGSPLPDESASYGSVVIDPASPERSLVLVEGDLAGGSDESSHLFLLRPRGECRRLVSFPAGYLAVSLAWAGR